MISATYRVQFHAEFGFARAAALAPYLRELGVSHLYASPIARARKGSMHGYDVVDPAVINPALGGEAGFRDMCDRLRAEGIGVILDIVPNHMAVGGDDSRWWQDVLQNGAQSRFATFFHIDWAPPDPKLRGRLLAPFLGRPYGEALMAGDLRLKSDRRGLAVWAHDHHRFPLRPQDVAQVEADGVAAYAPESQEGRDRLHDLLERQHYRLAWWRTAGDAINWRRFFDITELAGLQVERDDVFDAVHALPLRLYAEGLVDGLRIDHIDGLADPKAYLKRLREHLEVRRNGRPPDRREPPWLIVEKILARGEPLPHDWDCDGTSGYDFLNDVSALMHDPAGAHTLDRLWAEISGRPTAFAVEETLARAETLARGFAGQLSAAARAFSDLAQRDLKTRDNTYEGLRRALTALLTSFPAYRTYALEGPASPSDLGILSTAEMAARDLTPPLDQPALGQLVAWMGDPRLEGDRLQRRALQAFQQLSAPVAAKSVEDTAFYRFGRLISRNDVGCDPGRLGASLTDFHAATAERGRRHPRAMLATATHDHKRGEDVRARLAVLSHDPTSWGQAADRWMRRLGTEVDAADIYQMLQTLVGAWPLELAPSDTASLSTFADRVGEWQVKALREAKLRSSWIEPDTGYEDRCRAALDRALNDEALRADIHAFVLQIAPAGAANGLAQALLRCAAPGVPDTYQGCEFWDFSLVDPDNRRPVDFAARAQALSAPEDLEQLMATWRTGAIKQFLIRRTLNLRRSRPDCFGPLAYRPLTAEGLCREALIGFAAGEGEDQILVMAAIRAATAQIEGDRPRPAPSWWGDTSVHLPLSPTGSWRCLFSGHTLDGGQTAAAHLFAELPVALLSAR